MARPKSITQKVGEILVAETERLLRKSQAKRDLSAEKDPDDAAKCAACGSMLEEGLDDKDALLLVRLVDINRKIQGVATDDDEPKEQVSEDELLEELKKKNPDLYPRRGPKGPKAD